MKQKDHLKILKKKTTEKQDEFKIRDQLQLHNTWTKILLKKKNKKRFK